MGTAAMLPPKSKVQGPKSPKPAAPEAEKTGPLEDFRESAWDLAAVFMILLAYFTRLLVTEGRSYSEPSFLLLAGALLLSSALCVVLIALRPATFRPALLTLLTGAVLFMESGFPLPPEAARWLLDLGGPALVLTLRLVAYLLPIAVFYWLARERLSQLLTLIFGAIAAIGLVLH